MYYTACTSPLGEITLASDGENLTGLWLQNQKYHPGALLQKATPRDSLGVFASVKHWLSRYFAGDKPDSAALPLLPEGSVFRRRVWKHLLAIPYGQTTTYGAIALGLAKEDDTGICSARAVGGAVGHNPISILIPCHRVLGANGSLTGYAGGLAAKSYLLRLEGAVIPPFANNR